MSFPYLYVSGMRFLDSKSVLTDKIVKVKNLLVYVILWTEEVPKQHASLRRFLDVSFNEIEKLSISVWSTYTYFTCAQ